MKNLKKTKCTNIITACGTSTRSIKLMKDEIKNNPTFTIIKDNGPYNFVFKTTNSEAPEEIGIKALARKYRSLIIFHVFYGKMFDEESINSFYCMYEYDYGTRKYEMYGKETTFSKKVSEEDYDIGLYLINNAHSTAFEYSIGNGVDLGFFNTYYQEDDEINFIDAHYIDKRAEDERNAYWDPNICICCHDKIDPSY